MDISPRNNATENNTLISPLGSNYDPVLSSRAFFPGDPTKGNKKMAENKVTPAAKNPTKAASNLSKVNLEESVLRIHDNHYGVGGSIFDENFNR